MLAHTSCPEFHLTPTHDPRLKWHFCIWERQLAPLDKACMALAETQSATTLQSPPLANTVNSLQLLFTRAPQAEVGARAQIREKRQARFYEARMALAKQQARLADRKTVEEQVHLVKAPESLLKQQDAQREKLRIPVEQAAAQTERMAE